jgi:hypothetical protein
MTPDTFIFEDADVGVRFAVDARFVPGPGSTPTPGLGLDHVRTAYLAFTDHEGHQYVLSVTSVAVGYEMTRERLDELLALQNESTAQMAAERGWTVCEPGRATTLGGRLARRNEFVTPGTHPDDREMVAADEDAASHVQAWTAFVPGRAVSLMLGVHPPADLNEARVLMQTVTDSFEFIAHTPEDAT